MEDGGDGKEKDEKSHACVDRGIPCDRAYVLGGHMATYIILLKRAMWIFMFLPTCP